MAYKSQEESFGDTSTGFDPDLLVPADALEGDFMVVCVQTSDNAPDISPTPPSNETWTLAESGSMPIDGTSAASPNAVWIYYKDVSADDEANADSKTYQWTFGGSEEQMGVLFLFDPAVWGQFAKTELTGNRTSIDAPSVTTTVADETVYHCCKKDSGTAFTALPSGTVRVNENYGATNGAGAAHALIEEVFASPGATGTKTFEFDSEECDSYTFSVQHSPTGPVGDGAGVLSSMPEGTASGTVESPTTKYVRGLLYLADGLTLVPDGKILQCYNAADDSYFGEVAISDQTTYNFTFTSLAVVHPNYYVVLAPGQSVTDDQTVATKAIAPA